jgi:uncharacterized protein YbjT (DUF2867 family)
MSKVITILGGNGFIGSKCMFKLLRNVPDVKIYAISRSGEIKYPQNQIDKRVEIIKGDCLNPKDFESVIKSSTGIIHSIGVLLTNENSNYHLKNKETCLRVAEIANKGQKKPNFVYVSAMRGIPFPLSLKFHGYIDSKRECERSLLTQYSNINPIILRPGFVKSNEKLWTLPIYLGVNIAQMSEKLILSKLDPQIGEKFQIPSKGIELDVLTDFACAGALGLLHGSQIYENDYMISQEGKIKLS